jgi:hypothetical protein
VTLAISSGAAVISFGTDGIIGKWFFMNCSNCDVAPILDFIGCVANSDDLTGHYEDDCYYGGDKKLPPFSCSAVEGKKEETKKTGND